VDFESALKARNRDKGAGADRQGKVGLETDAFRTDPLIMDTSRKDPGKRSRNGAGFLAGQMLVAMPGIEDPRFERAVLYVCAHDAEQAMGLAVNRPVEGLTLFELLNNLGSRPRSRPAATW
jgi:hypothetical protein